MTHLEALAKAEQYQSKMQKLPKKVIGSHNIILVLLQIGLMTLMDFVILMVNIMYFINIIHILANGVLCIGDM